MRHRHGWRKLNITDGAHRRAMMRHICNALIEHEQITTTLPRAKELRRIIEPLVTLGKVPSVHRRRIAFARLQSRAAVSKLFNDLGARFSSRPGGYVRILKNGFRKGDNAPMALVEFVEKAAPAEIETDEKGGNTAKGGRKTSAAKTTKTASTKTASAESAKSAKTASTKTANAETAKTASTKTENTESAKTAKSASAESAKNASTKTASAESAKSAKTAKAETESKAAESGDSAATKTEKS